MEDALDGKIKKYFRTKHYGFIELCDPALREQHKDVFFHLDRIPSNIPLEKIVVGQEIKVRLKQLPKGWVADEVELP